MIIVEGPDGAGKTTLVNDIMNVFRDEGLELMPRVVSGAAKVMTNLPAWTEEQLRKGYGWRLYDRFSLISSPNYCMLPNPTFTGLFKDHWWLNMMWHRFKAINPLVICCLPPQDEVNKNVQSDLRNKVVMPHIEEIWCHYESMAAMMNWLVWDYTKPDNRQSILTSVLEAKIIAADANDRLKHLERTVDGR